MDEHAELELRGMSQVEDHQARLTGVVGRWPSARAYRHVVDRARCPYRPDRARRECGNQRCLRDHQLRAGGHRRPPGPIRARAAGSSVDRGTTVVLDLVLLAARRRQHRVSPLGAEVIRRPRAQQPEHEHHREERTSGPSHLEQKRATHRRRISCTRASLALTKVSRLGSSRMAPPFVVV